MFHRFLKSPLQCHANKEEKITFEQYSRIHLQGPKIAICETASNVVFVLNSSFTSKDQYFRTALQEATDAFNNMLKDFEYTQKLELYDRYNTKLILHRKNLFNNLYNTNFYLLLFHSSTAFRLQILHLSSMMH